MRLDQNAKDHKEIVRLNCDEEQRKNAKYSGDTELEDLVAGVECAVLGKHICTQDKKCLWQTVRVCNMYV